MDVSLNIIVPQKRINKKMKVLWLLHGGYADYTQWCKNSNIEKYVEGKNFYIVMPDVNNRFYADMVEGKKYFTYLTEELPHILSDLFPISNLCEDNYIAGESMGGYGAFKIALNYPNKYKMAAGLSGSMNLKAMYLYALKHNKAKKLMIFPNFICAVVQKIFCMILVKIL